MSEGGIAEEPSEVMRKLSLDEIKETIRPMVGPVEELPSSADVIIVGAGPIGLTAANQLGSLGIRTVLVERNVATADLPRALAVDDEFMRQLDALGMLPALEPHTSAPFGIHFHSADGSPVVQVSSFVTRNGFGNRNGVMQPVLEKELLRACARFPNVTMRYGCEVVGVEQSNGCVRVAVSTQSGPRNIQARFVLACDGAQSFVRSAVGISFEGERINEPHLVLDLADFPDDAPYSKFHCDPRRPFNSIPTPYGGRRIEFMLNPEDDQEMISRPESFRRLIDATPYRGAELHVVRSVVYGYSQRIASRMQENNVFLLGDAAHVMPPFGAQAMNTGARDVNNLCWKLHAVLSGTAGSTLLSTYDPERRPQISAVVEYSVRIGRLANIRSRPAAYLRDKVFKLLNLVPPIRRYLSSMRYMPRPRIAAGFLSGPAVDEHPLLGMPFPRVALANDAGQVESFDEAAGSGFSIVAIDLAPDAAAAFKTHPLVAALAPRFVAITLGNVDAGANGEASLLVENPRGHPDLQAHGGQFLLVRPDRYVAAAAAPDRFRSCLDNLMTVIDQPPASRAPLRRAASNK